MSNFLIFIFFFFFDLDLGKIFITSDAATILKELEIVHPAAKLVVMASEQQEQEVSHLSFFFNCSDSYSIDHMSLTFEKKNFYI